MTVKNRQASEWSSSYQSPEVAAKDVPFSEIIKDRKINY